MKKNKTKALGRLKKKKRTQSLNGWRTFLTAVTKKEQGNSLVSQVSIQYCLSNSFFFFPSQNYRKWEGGEGKNKKECIDLKLNPWHTSGRGSSSRCLEQQHLGEQGALPETQAGKDLWSRAQLTHQHMTSTQMKSNHLPRNRWSLPSPYVYI